MGLKGVRLGPKGMVVPKAGLQIHSNTMMALKDSRECIVLLNMVHRDHPGLTMLRSMFREDQVLTPDRTGKGKNTRFDHLAVPNVYYNLVMLQSQL